MIIDALVVIFIALIVGYCYKKGFAITIVNTFSCLFSIILTACFYKSVVEYILQSKFGLFVLDKISIILSHSFAQKADLMIEELPLPKILTKGIASGEFFQNVVSTLALNITSAIITILTVVLLFILIRLLLKLMKEPIKAIASLPIIKQADKLSGAVLGIVSGMFWVYVIMAVIAMLSFMPLLSSIPQMIMQTDVARIFYDNNILLYIIS